MTGGERDLRRVYAVAAWAVVMAVAAVVVQLVDPEWWWLVVTGFAVLGAAWAVHGAVVLRRLVRQDAASGRGE